MEIRESAGQLRKLGCQVKSARCDSAMEQPNRATVTLLKRIPRDAVERSKARSCPGEKKRLIGLAGNVEAIAGRSLDPDRDVGLRPGLCLVQRFGVQRLRVQPAAHCPAGNHAYVEFQRVFARQTGERIAASQSVFTKQTHELPGAVFEGGFGSQADAKNRSVQRINPRNASLDSLFHARWQDGEIAGRLQ